MFLGGFLGHTGNPPFKKPEGGNNTLIYDYETFIIIQTPRIFAFCYTVHEDGKYML